MAAKKSVVKHGATEALISRYRGRLAELAHELIGEFERHFRAADPMTRAEAVGEFWSFTEIRQTEDFENITHQPGFYVILSDVDLGDNECRLSVNDLPAIYRGHSSHIRERAMSHLDNDRYREMKDKKSQEPWSRCMKLLNIDPDYKGGINFDDADHRSSRWAVLTYAIPGSIEFIRQQAEWGFDDAFGQPKASRLEKAKRPEKLVTVA